MRANGLSGLFKGGENMENKENTKYVIIVCRKEEEPKNTFADNVKFGIGLFVGYALGKSIKKVIMNKIQK